MKFLHSLALVVTASHMLAPAATAQGRQTPAFPAPFPVAPVPYSPPAAVRSKSAAKPNVAKPTRLPMREGDIMVEGVVQGVSFVRRELKILATSFTLPDGRHGPIRMPKLKTVSFGALQYVAQAPYPTDGSTPRWSPVGALWPTYRVTVVGKDDGSGRPLDARLIEIGGQGSISWSSFRNTHNPGRTIFYDGAREHVAAAGMRVQQIFGIKAVVSKPGHDGARDEHADGLALDFMVGNDTKLGDGIAAFLEANAGVENIKYIQWKDTLVYPGSRTEWAGLAPGLVSKRTAAQTPHVHVSFLAHPMLPGPYFTDALISRASFGARDKRAKTH